MYCELYWLNYCHTLISKAGAEGRISNILTQYLSHLAWDPAEILKMELNLKWKEQVSKSNAILNFQLSDNDRSGNIVFIKRQKYDVSKNILLNQLFKLNKLSSS